LPRLSTPAVCLVTRLPIANISPLSLHDALPISSRGTASPVLSASEHARCISDCSSRSSLTSLRSLNEAWSTLSTSSLSVPSIQRSEEHTSELQSRFDLVCRLLLEQKQYRLYSCT